MPEEENSTFRKNLADRTASLDAAQDKSPDPLAALAQSPLAPQSVERIPKDTPQSPPSLEEDDPFDRMLHEGKNSPVEEKKVEVFEEPVSAESLPAVPQEKVAEHVEMVEQPEEEETLGDMLDNAEKEGKTWEQILDEATSPDAPLEDPNKVDAQLLDLFAEYLEDEDVSADDEEDLNLPEVAPASTAEESVPASETQRAPLAPEMTVPPPEPLEKSPEERIREIKESLLPNKENPNDPANDRYSCALVDKAFDEASKGMEKLPPAIAALCAITVELGGSGPIKKNLVEEAFELGRQAYEKKKQEVVSAVPLDTTKFDLSAMPAGFGVPETPIPPAPPSPDAIPPPAPDMQVAFAEEKKKREETEKEFEKFKQEVQDRYEKDTLEKRDATSAGLLSGGWKLKEWTGDIISGAVPKKWREKNQLLDVFAHDWEKSALEAKIQLRTIREEVRTKKRSNLRTRAMRMVGSGRVVAATFARIGRTVFTGFIPLRLAMFGALTLAGTGGFIHRYGERSTAHTLRLDEEKAFDDGLRLYQQAEQEMGGLAPNKEALDQAYLKRLPEELLERLKRTTPETREKLLQNWIQVRVKKKVEVIQDTIAKTDDENKKNKLYRKYGKVLNRYSRLIEQTGMIHLYALGAEKLKKLGRGATIGLSLEAWGEGAVGMFRLVSAFAHGEASLGVPSGAGREPLKLWENDAERTEKMKLFIQTKDWFAEQENKNDALAQLRAEAARTHGTAREDALKAFIQRVEETKFPRNLIPIETLIPGEQGALLNSLIGNEGETLGIRVAHFITAVKEGKISSDVFAEYYAQRVGGTKASPKFLEDFRAQFAGVIARNSSLKEGESPKSEFLERMIMYADGKNLQGVPLANFEVRGEGGPIGVLPLEVGSVVPREKISFLDDLIFKTEPGMPITPFSRAEQVIEAMRGSKEKPPHLVPAMFAHYFAAHMNAPYASDRELREYELLFQKALSGSTEEQKEARRSLTVEIEKLIFKHTEEQEQLNKSKKAQ